MMLFKKLCELVYYNDKIDFDLDDIQVIVLCEWFEFYYGIYVMVCFDMVEGGCEFLKCLLLYIVFVEKWWDVKYVWIVVVISYEGLKKLGVL